MHAGLVNDPIWSSSSSSRRRSEASLSGRDRDDRDDDRDGGDFDVMWPGRWRGGEALRRAVREVRTALVVEEEEEEDGAPLRRGYGDEGGKIDELGAGDVEFRPIFTSSSSASSPSMSSSSNMNNDFATLSGNVTFTFSVWMQVKHCVPWSTGMHQARMGQSFAKLEQAAPVMKMSIPFGSVHNL